MITDSAAVSGCTQCRPPLGAGSNWVSKSLIILVEGIHAVSIGKHCSLICYVANMRVCECYECLNQVVGKLLKIEDMLQADVTSWM